MHKIVLSISILLLTVHIDYAQVSGNQVYEDRNTNNKNITAGNGIVLEGDSVLYINAAVLLNTAAEYYIAVFGVGQFAKTLKDANTQLGKRVDKFIGSLQLLGIKKQDISVDFITQTKTYDYILSNNVATQTQTGFQVKKNVIVRFENLSELDNILINAADNEIYDLIKVDYGIKDQMGVHMLMINAASEIISGKRNLYLKSSAFELLPNSVIYRDNFYGVYPATQYKKYQAYETGNVNSYYDSKLVKKDMLTENTFYYEGSDISGYDKIINPGIPYVGIQFVLNYSVKCYIKRK